MNNPEPKSLLLATLTAGAALIGGWFFKQVVWPDAKDAAATGSSSSSGKYKMVACDMDGTLLNEHHKISQRSAAILHRLHQLGVHVVFCSGRMFKALTPYEAELNMDLNMVCYNGACVITDSRSGRQMVFQRPIPAHVMNAAIDFCNERNYVLQIYSDHKLYARCNNDQHRAQTNAYAELTGCEYIYVDSYEPFRNTTPDKVLIMTETPKVNALADEVIAAIPTASKDYHLVRGFFFVELLHPQSNKQQALTALCDHLKIKMEEVVGFGDGENDKEFLEGIGLGIAMQNAVDITKKRAKKVSQYTNKEDGVARELEALLAEGAFVTKEA